MAKAINYPFVPKSTTYLIEGQFWDVPLSNGLFACGRVLQFNCSGGKKDSRSFLAGLLDWISDTPPTPESIANSKLMDQGNAHINTIAFNKGMIRGFRPLALDSIVPMLELSEMPGKNCWLVRGYEKLRPATLQEQKTLYIRSTWGLGVITLLAESYFVKKSRPTRKLPWDEMQALIDL